MQTVQTERAYTLLKGPSSTLEVWKFVHNMFAVFFHQHIAKNGEEKLLPNNFETPPPKSRGPLQLQMLRVL